jgi:hypothetical protein
LSAFRCSTASLERSEPLQGTASTVRAFLLIECPGPWGEVALRDSRLPTDVASAMLRKTRPLGVRPLLIRRHRGRASVVHHVFLAYADPVNPWMQTVHLDNPAQLLDLDLVALSQGRSPGLETTTSPLFLVCTHGKHDVCCAEKGRPVAAALAEVEPDTTWDVSHIGGDRFAGNVLVLSHGLYYGRLDAESVVRMAAEHRAGRLDLQHLRGRTGFPFAVQAAEWFLRRELDVTGLGDLRLFAKASQGGDVEVDFRVCGEHSWRVRLTASHSQPQRLTCSSSRESPAPRFDLAAIARLD